MSRLRSEEARQIIEGLEEFEEKRKRIKTQKEQKEAFRADKDTESETCFCSVLGQNSFGEIVFSDKQMGVD